MNDQIIAGVVLLVADRERVLALETAGSADLDAKTPMSENALFWIASNSKQITAAALMLLVDEGKVSLDDPVEKYLPLFHGQMVVAEEDEEHRLLRKPVQPPTLRHLLSHTSGILSWYSNSELNTDTLEMRVLACALTPLRFSPGTRWEYGNGPFEVIGRIIEVVSGLPLEQFLQTRLFAPLGMTDTTFWPTHEQLARLAKSYRPNPDGPGLTEAQLPFTYPLENLHGSPSPGGGLFSTASDVCRFGQMILNDGVFEGTRYLTEASVREMTSNQVDDLFAGSDSENGYGLGWVTTRKASREAGVMNLFQHGGAYGTNLWIDPNRSLVKVFLIQQAGYPEGMDGGVIANAFSEAADQAFAPRPKESA